MRMFYTVILLIIILLAGCASNQDSKYSEWPPSCYKPRILPPGNVARIDSTLNHTGNDIAPVQRPIVKTGDFSQCGKEFEAEKQIPADGINASTFFVQDTFQIVNRLERDMRAQAYEYLTDNIESITFLDRTRGFVSFSHPPSPSFARKIGLPLTGISGGTDIFEFKLTSPDNFIFENVQPVNKINTEYWDSHPFAYYFEKDGRRFTVLFWASDKEAPYSHADSVSGVRLARGGTNIYYIVRDESTGLWDEPVMLPEGINLPDSYEGSPFVYCSCLNPVLLFSSNRGNQDPGNLKGKFKEDFDLHYVRLSIELINNKIVINPLEEVKSFRKGSETEFFTDAGKPDSTINTYSDERFPFIPYPVNIEGNNYLYFSSNRNQKISDYGKTKSAVINRGGYDIYRFALPDDFPACKPVPKKINIEVYVKDAITGKNVPDAFVKLNYGDRELISRTGVTPARFDSLEIGTQYEIYGGSKFKSMKTDECGDIDTVYHPTAKINHFFTAEIPELIELKDYVYSLSEFQSIQAQTIYDTVNTVKYINTFKFDVTEFIIKEPFGKAEFTEDNKNVKIQYRITKNYEVEPYEGKKSVLSNMDIVFESNSDVLTGNVKSELTVNNALYTSSLPNGALIRDTVYLIPKETRINCIKLIVNLRDNCSDADVRNPVIKVVEYDIASGTETVVENGYAESVSHTVQLKTGKLYRVYGGSNFKDLSECPEMMYYIDARAENECDLKVSDLSNYKYDVDNIAKGANILSFNSYENGYFDTRNITEDTVIRDEIELRSVYFKKPKCEHYFTDLQDSLHRRVPYFQTAFWEVNTRNNLRDVYPRLTVSNRLYGDPYTIMKGQFDECESCMNGRFSGEHWPGAKWIELHENNSNYIGSPGRRDIRYRHYRQMAERVDNNLANMVKVISDTLIPSFELLDSLDEDNDMKLIIRVEAWSDFRPVCCGWYVSKNESERIINYAECKNISDFDGKMPDYESVIVRDGQSLGSRNNVLSKLRAYFGYMQLYKSLLSNERFKKYADAGLVLLPNDLVDGTGVLLADAMLKHRIERSKIIFVTKGFDTNPVSDKPWYYPKFTETPDDPLVTERMKETVAEEKLSEVRTIQVFSKVRKYVKGVGFVEKCCE